MFKRKDKPQDRFEETKNMTGFEKATAGEWFCFNKEKDLWQLVDKAWRETTHINDIAKINRSYAGKLLNELCPNVHESVTIVPPTLIEYPTRLFVGENTFINMDSTFLSAGKIEIGKNCFIGPKAQFWTPNHIVDDPDLRREGWQYDAPIKIGDAVWLAGGVTVCPGVVIGSNVVVGAGSVITKDVPDNVMLGGNPAKIIREL
jgi:maltose O-acetyltransferase